MGLLTPHATQLSPCQVQDWTSSPCSVTWGPSLLHPTPHLQAPMGDDFALSAGPSSPFHLLPSEVAIMTLQGHPELRALLFLLKSKQDMLTLANDLKTAWRQDLQVVQTHVNTLQDLVQKVKYSEALMQHLISTVQATLTAWDSLHQTLVTQLDDF